MLWIILLLVVVAVVAYRFRVPLLAKILGQPQSRIERRIERRKD
jgi:F0F1-type ATP synthase membrane subunit b/b'